LDGLGFTPFLTRLQCTSKGSVTLSREVQCQGDDMMVCRPAPADKAHRGFSHRRMAESTHNNTQAHKAKETNPIHFPTAAGVRAGLVLQVQRQSLVWFEHHMLVCSKFGQPYGPNFKQPTAAMPQKGLLSAFGCFAVLIQQDSCNGVALWGYGALALTLRYIQHTPN
jgi:hypothetical protein